MLCLPCLGSGEFPKGRRCPRCGGGGELSDIRLTNAMCPFCVGTGRDPHHKGKLCIACEGWARVSGPADSRRASETKNDAAGEPDGETNPKDPSLLNGATPGRSIELEEVLLDLVGDVDICYPTITGESLDRVRLLERCDMIRVLTNEVESDLLPRIREFVRDLPRFLFRRYGGREIRDRYLLTSTEIIFVGPSPENGDGHSPTLIRVPVDVAGEMIQDMRLGFNQLWGAGNTLA